MTLQCWCHIPCVKLLLVPSSSNIRSMWPGQRNKEMQLCPVVWYLLFRCKLFLHFIWISRSQCLGWTGTECKLREVQCVGPLCFIKSRGSPEETRSQDFAPAYSATTRGGLSIWHTGGPVFSRGWSTQQGFPPIHTIGQSGPKMPGLIFLPQSTPGHNYEEMIR